jgi:hypothetical protein
MLTLRGLCAVFDACKQATAGVALLAALGSGTGSDAAVSAPRGTERVPGLHLDEIAPMGQGCYWMRQRLYCSRYCYIEIDGRRYCREREYLGFPQAPDELVEPRLPRMK